MVDENNRNRTCPRCLSKKTFYAGSETFNCQECEYGWTLSDEDLE